MMRTRVVLFLVTTILSTGMTAAGVLRVEQDGSGEYLLIQDAVDAATDGDTILIGPGRYDDLQVRGSMSSTSVVYWEDERSLSFIGTSADEVIIGPTSYSPVGAGPQGIHQHGPADVRVENLTFENLKFSIVAGRGRFYAERAHFLVGDYGLLIQDPDTCSVRDCSFNGFADHAVGIFNADHGVIENCEFTNADIYFGSTRNGVVRLCTVANGRLVTYFMSEGLVEDCDVQSDVSVSCIYVDTLSPPRLTVIVRGNVFRGGGANVSVVGSGSLVYAERNEFSGPTDWDTIFALGDRASLIAHNNHIRRIGDQYLVTTTSYRAGNDAIINLGSNYWFDDGTPAQLDSLIHDGNDDPELHILVNYDPILTDPVAAEKQSFGSFKARYR